MSKIKFNYKFDYKKAGEDKDIILKQIDYPYKKYIYSDRKIIRNFIRLIRSKTTIIHKPYTVEYIHLRPDELLFDNKYTLIINRDDEYEKIDMISDYFNEECRVKCRFATSIGTTYDYYHKHFNDILKYMEREHLKIKLKNISDTIWKYGKREKYIECSTFRPKIILYFISFFKARKILDISSGWGDRLIGAMASDIDCYHGFDPNPCLHKNYDKMIRFFKDYIKNKSAEFIIKELPFEKAVLNNNFYDLVMTSPPYFDIEIYDKYSDKQSTFNVNEKQWYDMYLTVWIEKCFNALRVGGILALNINQFKWHSYVNWLLTDMRKNSKWNFLGTIGYTNENMTKKVQPVFIWKKV